MKPNDLKKLASQYVKIVEWSDEDNAYVGRCPELFYGGTHGSDEGKVYVELCVMVEEELAARLHEKRPLPKPVKSARYSGKFVLRLNPELHKALAVKAFQKGKSLNDLCISALTAA